MSWFVRGMSKPRLPFSKGVQVRAVRISTENRLWPLIYGSWGTVPYAIPWSPCANLACQTVNPCDERAERIVLISEHLSAKQKDYDHECCDKPQPILTHEENPYSECVS